MNDFFYCFTPEKRIDNKTVWMATVEVINNKEQVVGTYSWSRKPSDQQVQEMVNQLMADHEISKVWNRFPAHPDIKELTERGG